MLYEVRLFQLMTWWGRQQ